MRPLAQSPPNPVVQIATQARRRDPETAVSANDNSKSTSSTGPLSIERIEEMLLFAAQLVDAVGPAAEPLLARLEKEYVSAKQRGKASDRIRQLIAAA